MLRQVVPVAVALAVLAPPTAAQFVGQPAPEISAPNYMGKEDHFSIASARGKPLLLVFLRTEDDACIKAVPTLLSLHKKYGPRGLELVGLCSEDKEPVERFVSEHKIPFRYGYGGDPDETYDVSAYPEAFLIDASGVIAWRGEVSDELDARVARLMARGSSAGDKGADARRLEEAARSDASGNILKAYTLARQVAELGDKSLKSKADDLTKSLEEKARRQVDEVRDAIGNDQVDEALCRRAADLLVRFEGSEAGREASTQVQRLRGHAAGKAHVDAALAAARAARIADLADDAATGKEYARALQLYRELADQYAATPAGKDAKAALQRIQGDPAAQSALQAARNEDQADRWLDIAERYARLKLPEPARQYLEKVIQTHPTSRAAEQAKQRLAALGKP